MSGTTSLVEPGDFTPPGAGNGVTDFINNSSNVGKEVAQTIASEILSRAAQKAGGALLGTGVGALVQPAVWVLGGQAPQPGDIPLYGMGIAAGLTGPIGAGASMIVGLVKAAVEDEEDRIIAAAVAREPAKYRPFIKSVRNYGANGRAIVAMTIASCGGVTWRVARSTWVYITDARDRLVCDYEPAYAMEIYAPNLPLRITGRHGSELRYRWSRRRGNIHG